MTDRPVSAGSLRPQQPADAPASSDAPSSDAQPSPNGQVFASAPSPEPAQAPLYWRALRLRHIHPNGWQRAVLVEGVLAIAVTLVLADVASAWTLFVLPLASAMIVKAHDVLTGMLHGSSRRSDGGSGGDG